MADGQTVGHIAPLICLVTFQVDILMAAYVQYLHKRVKDNLHLPRDVTYFIHRGSGSCLICFKV